MKIIPILVMSLALTNVAVSAADSYEFQLSSPDIQTGAAMSQRFVFKGFGCEGENESPVLSWHNAPAETKSFALMMYDPDAPTGSGWWHWAVANIPPDTNQLPRDAGRPDSPTLPEGAIQLRNDFGSSAYGGPCPPEGDAPHRYQFMIFALDVSRLPIKPENSPAMLGFMARQHSLSSAELVTTYGR